MTRAPSMDARQRAAELQDRLVAVTAPGEHSRTVQALAQEAVIIDAAVLDALLGFSEGVRGWLESALARNQIVHQRDREQAREFLGPLTPGGKNA